MTNEEYIFKESVKEAKALARNARYKTGKRGGKTCRLSSDTMTKKEWEKRNGPVITISKNVKMTWREFKRLERFLQREYIEIMRREYGARQKDLAEMFEVNGTTMNEYFRTYFPDMHWPIKKSTDPRWAKFMAGESAEENTAEKKTEAPNELREKVPMPESKANITDGSIIATGAAFDIFTKVLPIFGDKEYHMEIRFYEVTENVEE